ncbi:hypothetical protein, partial [Enterococcus faecalis]|uniref:hypothetical protein n=1 Tax=Enterococcus faecalis TaxID=1351 RepID=UPI003CC676A0
NAFAGGFAPWFFSGLKKGVSHVFFCFFKIPNLFKTFFYHTFIMVKIFFFPYFNPLKNNSPG